MVEKDKIKKLFQSTVYEDRLLACSLLEKCTSVRKFIREWEIEVYGFKKEADNRPRILLPYCNEVEIYYEFGPRTYLLLEATAITLCYKNYNPGLKVIHNEKVTSI